MATENHSVICLMGPTASGKTQLALQLVKRFPFEIISVDSAMVYRGMDVGTAKPSPDILTIAPHRLINIREPENAYSAAQFREDALTEIAAIQALGKIPLLVGGTMLYFKALCEGIAAMPTANLELRSQLASEGTQHGWPALHKRLIAVDPVAGQRIHPHDSQRIQRALEVHTLTGKSLTSWHADQAKNSLNYQWHYLVVAPHDRAILHDRIQQRFLQMLEAGFVHEVQGLFDRGYLNMAMPSIRSVGYRQVWSYLEGTLSFEEMREKAIIATRQLAKRQLTWLRSWPDAVWFNSEASDLVTQVVAYLTQALL